MIVILVVCYPAYMHGICCITAIYAYFMYLLDNVFENRYVEAHDVSPLVDAVAILSHSDAETPSSYHLCQFLIHHYHLRSEMSV